MKLKQFLKPDWKKIVLTIIISLFFIGYWTYTFFQGLFSCPLIVGLERSCNYTYYELPWETCTTYCGKPDILTSIMIAIYPILWFFGIFVIPYPLSCLIVWIYDKARKKK